MCLGREEGEERKERLTGLLITYFQSGSTVDKYSKKGTEVVGR